MNEAKPTTARELLEEIEVEVMSMVGPSPEPAARLHENFLRLRACLDASAAARGREIGSQLVAPGAEFSIAYTVQRTVAFDGVSGIVVTAVDPSCASWHRGGLTGVRRICGVRTLTSDELCIARPAQMLMVAGRNATDVALLVQAFLTCEEHA